MTLSTTNVSAEDRQLARIARRLAAAIEPVAAQVFFAPECQAAYVDLGFDPSPAVDGFGVPIPEPVSYLYSRGSALGDPVPAAVAAALGVFEPDEVSKSWCAARNLVSPKEIARARTEGAIRHLVRILGDNPAGLSEATALLQRAVATLPIAASPMSASLRDREPSDHPLGRMWQLAEVIREFRGEAHVSAWVAAGLTAPEILVLTEKYWGLEQFSYAPSRGWSMNALRNSVESLRMRGLLSPDDLTPAGSQTRDLIEVQTDRRMRPAVDALGESLATLITILRSWGNRIKEHRGYLHLGPHELAPRSAL